jgi:hypothetical protein
MTFEEYDFTIPECMVCPLMYGDYSDLHDHEIDYITHEFIEHLPMGGGHWVILEGAQKYFTPTHDFREVIGATNCIDVQYLVPIEKGTT